MKNTPTAAAATATNAAAAPDPSVALAKKLVDHTSTARALVPHVSAPLLRKMLIAALDSIDANQTARRG